NINYLKKEKWNLKKGENIKKNKLMEVTIERENTGTDVVEPNFTFEAKGKETKDTYPAQKVYESDDMMVIHIKNVPDNYHVIGLFVTEHRDNKILKQEYKHELKDDNDDVSTDTEKMAQSSL